MSKLKLIKDLGQIFPNENCKQKARIGIYECPVCKNQSKRRIASVEYSKTTKCQSCANRISSTKHGLRNHVLYSTWDGMKGRCLNKSHKYYSYYGKRGIKISEEFKDFSIWLKYVESLDNCYKEGCTLDRINNNGNYERDNLRWASRSQQQSNSRKLRENNTSGYRGVSFNKSKKKWVAEITANKQRIRLGNFKHAYTAAYAYDSYVVNNNLCHTKNFL